MGITWGTPTVITTDAKHYYAPHNYRSYIGSGSTLSDLIPSGSDGTLVGSPTYSDPAFSYNGSTQYVDIDGITTARASDTQGAVEIWIKPTDATPSSDETLFCFGDTNGDEYLLCEILTSGKIRITARTSVAVQFDYNTSTAPLSDSTWHQVIFNQPATAPEIYVDGSIKVLDSVTSTTPAAWFSTLTNLDNGRIACDNYNSAGNANFFTGDVGAFIVYNDDLSAAEITQNYNALNDIY